jgi:hypothetical protein
MKEERLAASRCDRAETRGADETDVRRSMELLSAQMVIYPNAIVDHHFDELMFFLYDVLSSASFTFQLHLV